jgi:hypothetical protein
MWSLFTLKSDEGNRPAHTTQTKEQHHTTVLLRSTKIKAQRRPYSSTPSNQYHHNHNQRTRPAQRHQLTTTTRAPRHQHDSATRPRRRHHRRHREGRGKGRHGVCQGRKTKEQEIFGHSYIHRDSLTNPHGLITPTTPDRNRMSVRTANVGQRHVNREDESRPGKVSTSSAPFTSPSRMGQTRASGSPAAPASHEPAPSPPPQRPPVRSWTVLCVHNLPQSNNKETAE